MSTAERLVEIQLTQDEIKVASAEKEAAWNEYRKGVEADLSQRYTLKINDNGRFDGYPVGDGGWFEFQRAWLKLERLYGRLGRLLASG